ncbi:DUF2867 domain-containing protein [Vibrio stylophorae]|nr:DUF2867 domain-containing protein [Vibrio stylophorae]
MPKHSFQSPKGQQTALIIGATGYIANHLIPALLIQGIHVIAAARQLSVLEKRCWAKDDNVTLMRLDLSLPIEASQQTLFNQADICYFLVHGMAHGHDFIDYEQKMAGSALMAFNHAATHGKLSHIIYLGALQPTDNASAHLAARAQTGEILRKGLLPVIEVRAGIIIGAGSAAFEVMCDLVHHFPVLLTPKWISSVSPPIALENLLFYLIAIGQDNFSQNAIYDVSGPESMTYRQQIERLCQLFCKPARVYSMPFIPLRFSLWWLRLVTSVPYNIARALAAGLTHDLYANSRAIEHRYPQKLIDFDSAVHHALAKQDAFVRSDVWGFDPDALDRWQSGFGYYPKKAGAAIDTALPPQALWQILRTFGRKQDYFYANWLWRIRSWLDRLAGASSELPSPQANEGKQALKIGEYIETWKVIGLEPKRYLSLLFGMKGPGLGRLDFTITPIAHQRYRLEVTAWWHPKGIYGLLYWYAMFPAHLFIFKGLVRKICKKAKRLMCRTRKQSPTVQNTASPIAPHQQPDSPLAKEKKKP